MLDLLSQQARTTGDLCAAFPGLSRFAVMKHLRVLEDSGLLLTRKDGRQVWNHLNAVPLREVYQRWVGGEASRLAGALLRLRDVAERATEPVSVQRSAGPPLAARFEMALDAHPGAAWPRIRTRAARMLRDVAFPDDHTLEGLWLAPHGVPPVRVRMGIGAASTDPADRGAHVWLTATPEAGGPPPGAAILAAAAEWLAE